VSRSAAVGVRSGGGGFSVASLLGGLEPSCDLPSPQAGEFLRSLGPSWLGGRSKLRPLGVLGGKVGVRGPLRSQLEKSRCLPSPCSKGGRREGRSPESAPKSPPLLKFPLSGRLLAASGRGPLRVQSIASRVS
jgi:hypothetical protein